MIRLYRDYELDPDGVTTVWKWSCSHHQCRENALNGTALYWENSMRGASQHLAWHAQRGELSA